jgi:hypothetical protein
VRIINPYLSYIEFTISESPLFAIPKLQDYKQG